MTVMLLNLVRLSHLHPARGVPWAIGRTGRVLAIFSTDSAGPCPFGPLPETLPVLPSGPQPGTRFVCQQTGPRRSAPPLHDRGTVSQPGSVGYCIRTGLETASRLDTSW